MIVPSSRAYEAATETAFRKLIADPKMLATEVSIGFTGKPKDEVQVFIRVCRFSQKLLKEKPYTGGLYVYDEPGGPSEEVFMNREPETPEPEKEVADGTAEPAAEEKPKTSAEAH